MADETKTQLTKEKSEGRPTEETDGGSGDNLSQPNFAKQKPEESQNSTKAIREGAQCRETTQRGIERSETGGGQKEAGGSDESPLRVTQIAAEKIAEVAAATHLGEYRLRVKVIGGGCAGFSYDLAFEEKIISDAEGEKKVPAKPDDPVNPTDTIFTDKGVCFVVDQMSLMYLRGTEIDYVETLAATGFKFNNPNTSSTCGCGSSFSV